MDWWDVLKIPRESTRDQIQAAYFRAWTTVGAGNLELEDNKVKMKHETYMRFMGEIKEIDRAYHEALGEVKN